MVCVILSKVAKSRSTTTEIQLDPHMGWTEIQLDCDNLLDQLVEKYVPPLTLTVSNAAHVVAKGCAIERGDAVISYSDFGRGRRTRRAPVTISDLARRAILPTAQEFRDKKLETVRKKTGIMPVLHDDNEDVDPVCDFYDGMTRRSEDRANGPLVHGPTDGGGCLCEMVHGARCAQPQMCDVYVKKHPFAREDVECERKMKRRWTSFRVEPAKRFRVDPVETLLSKGGPHSESPRGVLTRTPRKSFRFRVDPYALVAFLKTREHDEFWNGLSAVLEQTIWFDEDDDDPLRVALALEEMCHSGEVGGVSWTFFKLLVSVKYSPETGVQLDEYLQQERRTSKGTLNINFF